MSPWFTTEKISEDTYVISEYRHQEETHVYLLIGSKQDLLIDTGLGIMNIADIVLSLSKHPIIVCATHVHWDHIGSHASFQNIAVHEQEASWLEESFPLPLPFVKQQLLKGLTESPLSFHIDSYQIYKGKPSQILHDQDIIYLGNREITVFHTPGHSPGHMCFYERSRAILYTGDLIYQGCLYVNYPSTDPYAYLQSLQRLSTLPIHTLFPAHHQLYISSNLLSNIYDAFQSLADQKKLHHCSGLYDYDKFSISL